MNRALLHEKFFLHVIAEILASKGLCLRSTYVNKRLAPKVWFYSPDILLYDKICYEQKNKHIYFWGHYYAYC